VLSRNLFTRAMSFETALVAAFAPFYNSRLYEPRFAIKDAMPSPS
jgi:hypothetical protein